MSSTPRSPMTVSPLWLQAAVVTFLVGFAILGYLAIKVYQEHPPLPGRVASADGRTIFTGDDVRAGQELFLTYGLMQYGSIYGHGAYLGPDFTADYLHRAAVEMQQQYGGDAEAEVRVRSELQANRYDAEADVLTWSAGQVQAFESLCRHYQETILDREQSGGGGLGPHAIAKPEAARQIVAFIAWTAWTSSARRPDRPYSYTNNWPPEPLVGNQLTQEAVVWSALSIVALLGGTGLLLTLFGRYASVLGWHGTEERRLRFRPPGEVALTPAQRATAWYFFIVAALFLVQTLLGGATAHYHAESGGFFGFDLARLPALQPDAHLAPAVGAVLRGGRLPGRRHFSGPDDFRRRAARAASADLRAVGGAGDRGRRQPGGRGGQLQRLAGRRRSDRSSAPRAGNISILGGCGRCCW